LLSLVFGGLAAVAQAQVEVAPPPMLAAAGGASTLNFQAPPEVAPQPKADGVSSIVISTNFTKPLKMTTGKRIRKATNDNDQVIRITQSDDPMTINITGLQPGKATVVMTDVDDRSETYEVIVQFDVEYLKSLFQRAVPTANVIPIPGSQGSIILTGYVAHAEDVDTVLRIAASVVGGGPNAVINALRVGGVMQVQLDVVIAEVNRNEIRYMDFEFINDGFQHLFSNGMTGVNLPQGAITGSFPGSPTILNAIGQANAAPINMFLGIFTPRQDFFSFLQLLRDEGVAKLLTQPKLVTLSGRPAHFVSGGEVPIPASGGLGTTTVSFKQIGTLVTLLPVVLGNGKIHLEVEPEVSERNDANSINVGGTFIPGFSTRRVRTAVEMESGQTLAIGGLIEHRSRTNTRKVPFLGDLPFLGAAFSTKVNEEIEVELVLLVTPHLVDPMSCDQVPKVLPGQETRVADDFELYLEGIQEAPRGCRDVFVNHHYLPAYKNSPSAGKYPCCPGCPQHGPVGVGAGSSNGCSNGEGMAMPAGAGSAVSTPMTTTVPEATPMSALPVDQMQHTMAAKAAAVAPAPTSLPAGMDSGTDSFLRGIPATTGSDSRP
jgi:pilus assembly protein CpaC